MVKIVRPPSHRTSKKLIEEWGSMLLNALTLASNYKTKQKLFYCIPEKRCMTLGAVTIDGCMQHE